MRQATSSFGMSTKVYPRVSSLQVPSQFWICTGCGRKMPPTIFWLPSTPPHRSYYGMQTQALSCGRRHFKKACSVLLLIRLALPKLHVSWLHKTVAVRYLYISTNFVRKSLRFRGDVKINLIHSQSGATGIWYCVSSMHVARTVRNSTRHSRPSTAQWLEGLTRSGQMVAGSISI